MRDSEGKRQIRNSKKRPSTNSTFEERRRKFLPIGKAWLGPLYKKGLLSSEQHKKILKEALCIEFEQLAAVQDNALLFRQCLLELTRHMIVHPIDRRTERDQEKAFLSATKEVRELYEDSCSDQDSDSLRTPDYSSSLKDQDGADSPPSPDYSPPPNSKKETPSRHRSSTASSLKDQDASSSLPSPDYSPPPNSTEETPSRHRTPPASSNECKRKPLNELSSAAVRAHAILTGHVSQTTRTGLLPAHELLTTDNLQSRAAMPEAVPRPMGRSDASVLSNTAAQSSRSLPPKPKSKTAEQIPSRFLSSLVRSSSAPDPPKQTPDPPKQIFFPAYLSSNSKVNQPATESKSGCRHNPLEISDSPERPKSLRRKSKSGSAPSCPGSTRQPKPKWNLSNRPRTLLEDLVPDMKVQKTEGQQTDSTVKTAVNTDVVTRSALGPIVPTSLPDMYHEEHEWWYPCAKDMPALMSDFHPYGSVSVGKYHPKVQILRLRLLLSVCTEAMNNKASQQQDGSGGWIRNYFNQIKTEEVISCWAGDLQLGTSTQLPPVCQWMDEAQGTFRIHGEKGLLRLAKLVNWDDRNILCVDSAWKTNYLFYTYQMFDLIDPARGIYKLNAEAQEMSSADDIYRLKPDLSKAIPAVPCSTSQRTIQNFKCPYFDEVIEVSIPLDQDFGPPSDSVSSPSQCIRNVIFTPSYRRARVALFDTLWSDIPDKNHCLHVVLVRPSEMTEYIQHWDSSSICFLQLPSKLDTTKIFDVLGHKELTTRYSHWQASMEVDKGGVGYARLVGQLFAFWMGWDFIWFLDDNVQSCQQLPVGPLIRDRDHRAGQKPKSCSLIDVLIHIEQQLLEKGSWNLAVGARESKVPKGSVAEYSGPSANYAILGLKRVWSTYNTVFKPFSSVPVYSTFLLNVAATVKRGVLIPPKAFWEDIEFCHMCIEEGLYVIRYNTLFHQKRNFQKNLDTDHKKKKSKDVDYERRLKRRAKAEDIVVTDEESVDEDDEILANGSSTIPLANGSMPSASSTTSSRHKAMPGQSSGTFSVSERESSSMARPRSERSKPEDAEDILMAKSGKESKDEKDSRKKHVKSNLTLHPDDQYEDEAIVYAETEEYAVLDKLESLMRMKRKQLHKNHVVDEELQAKGKKFSDKVLKSLSRKRNGECGEDGPKTKLRRLKRWGSTDDYMQAEDAGEEDEEWP